MYNFLKWFMNNLNVTPKLNSIFTGVKISDRLSTEILSYKHMIHVYTFHVNDDSSPSEIENK